MLILLNIKKINRKLDSYFDLDKDILQLWVCTPVGMGYIKKQSEDYYIITEKKAKTGCAGILRSASSIKC